MARPGINVTRADQILRQDQPWQVAWEDRHDPRYRGKVEIRDGAVWISLWNPDGEDHTGMRRPVQIYASSETPLIPGPIYDPMPPPPSAPLPPSTVPDSARVLAMRGNFLSFVFDEPIPSKTQWVFGYLSTRFAGRRFNFRRAYREAGNTHVPFSAYGQYHDIFPWYDYRTRLDDLALHYDELHADGLVPMLFVATDDLTPHTWDSLRRDADILIPHALRYGVRFFVTGWETDQIGGYLRDHGQHTLNWIAYLHELLPSDAVLAHHPGAHRTDDQEMLYSGWFEDQEWDRYDWCRRAHAAGLTAMLANFSPDCDEDQLIMLLCDEPQKHGAGPGALGMWLWAGLQGYLFEFAQMAPSRHAHILTRARRDVRLLGWC